MRYKKNQAKYFYMFIMPWFLGFFLLTFMPLVYSIYLSLTQYNGISMPKFIGLRNYIDLLFYDDLFRKSLFNSFHYAVLAVPTSLILALFMAFLLSKEIKISKLNLKSKLSPIIFLENKKRLIIRDKVKKIKDAAICIKSIYLPSPA